MKILESPAPLGPWRSPVAFDHLLTFDSQIERFNAECGIPVTFDRAGRGPPSVRFDGVQSEGLSLWTTSSSTGFLTRPKTDLDLITIRFVTAGSMVRRDQRREHVAGRGHAMLVTFDDMREEEASEGFEATSATLTRGSLYAARVALEGDDDGRRPDFVPALDTAGLPMSALLLTMKAMQRRLRSANCELDMVVPLIQELFVYQVLACWPRTEPQAASDARRPGRRVVSLARDYIEANLSRRLSMAEVAAAAGVGVRRLQVAFDQEFGKSPVRYILDRRLDRVNSDLRSPDGEGASVKAIAEMWGFTHMSDFSRRYRDRFGVSPNKARRIGS